MIGGFARRIKASILLTMFFASVIAIPSVEGTAYPKSIRLEDLLQGVPFTEQTRLKIEDIRVGTKSVKELFDNLDQKAATWWEYYTFKETTMVVKISNHEKLAQLQQALSLESTDRLRVILKDNRPTIWKHVPGLNSENLYVSTIEILIIQSPCDEVTRIVYSSINSIIKQKIEKTGMTDKNINLNEVFDKLLHDDLEPYMASLTPVAQNDPCFKTFQLLKWIRGDDVPGFDSGEYNLHEGLQRGLEPTIVALLQTYSNWSKYNLKVRVTGYTDRQTVITNKDFQLTGSGISGWNTVENPRNLKYSGCRGDHLTGDQPIYLDFVQSSGTPIKQITDNCTLGAARAYVTTAYLKYKLALPGVEYYYATGGIYQSGNGSTKSDPFKRRIDVEFALKAAKDSGN